MDKRASSKCIDYKKNIAITIGDPGGIGPEITLKAIDKEILEKANIIVIGHKNVIEKASNLINLNIPINFINDISKIKPLFINVISVDVPDCNFSIKSTSKVNGFAAYQFILKAIELAMKNEVHAIVTAPISKKGLQLAGINFPGHTEILAFYSKTEKYRMMFLNDKIKLILHTIHIPLKKVFSFIKKEKIIETINIGIDFLIKRCGEKEPLIFVAGLNPHAGEDGLLGDEEINEIIPAINFFKDKGIKIMGPFPPDIIFFKALEDKASLVVSLYHDQGLAPIKTLDFFGTVNVTAGLPFIRTSPDHGTGFDIAWKNIANPNSMKKAIEFALNLKNT